MTSKDFLIDVCPNHTESSKWNKAELLHILELYKEHLLSNSKSFKINVLADLNHNIINSAMNISFISKDEKINKEVEKIIDSIKSFMKNYNKSELL